MQCSPWPSTLDECEGDTIAKILFSRDIWLFHAFLTWHKILKALGWLSSFPFQKKLFLWTMKLVLAKCHFSNWGPVSKGRDVYWHFSTSQPSSPWNRINHIMQINWALEHHNLSILGEIFRSLCSRFQTGWDLGLGSFYYSACTWIKRIQTIRA